MFDLVSRARYTYRKLWPWIRYGSIHRFILRVEKKEIVYATTDAYSRSWFLPRYADGRMHEPAVSKLLLELVKTSNAFLDVGMNLGYFTCLASKFMPSGIVYGFEMNEIFFRLAKDNVALNACSNVTLHRAAVSDTCGEVFYKVSSNQGLSFLTKMTAARTARSGLASVKSVTLDELVGDRLPIPALLKIDVEGAELKVLNGMRRMLRRDHDIRLLIELHPSKLGTFEASTTDVLNLLFNNGFQVHEIKDTINDGLEVNLKSIDRQSVLTKVTKVYAHK